MKSTIRVDQIRELLDREARGDFGEEGLGLDFQWLMENWKMARAMSKGKPLLNIVGVIVIPALARFVAGDHFQEGGFPLIGTSLRKWLMGKSENGVKDPLSLRYSTLITCSTSMEIVRELGGEDSVETTLAEIFWLMECQKNGEDGALLANVNYANAFYVRDASGDLRVVRVYWRDNGWLVEASSVEYPRGWCPGDRVFSHNP